ncbi:ATP-dependent DNA ligase [Kribbella sp. NBC_01484]|uniref:ATP-dependent DNA ligase n=1 Tax=Kribbella sp. NBC_01484 TaxID=2903579 RepID=UPI003FA5337F
MARDGKVRLWSRNGKEFTDKFPDVVGALEAQLRVDCVLDGELVVWTGERVEFDALQRRMVNTAATVRRRLVVKEPARSWRSMCWRSTASISAICGGRSGVAGWSRWHRTGALLRTKQFAVATSRRAEVLLLIGSMTMGVSIHRVVSCP